MIVALSQAPNPPLSLRLANSDHRDALSFYALVEPDARNWRLTANLALVDGAWGTGSHRSLEGAEAERSHLFTFRHVPRGEILIVVSLYDHQGKRRASVDRRVYHSP